MALLPSCFVADDIYQACMGIGFYADITPYLRICCKMKSKDLTSSMFIAERRPSVVVSRRIEARVATRQEQREKRHRRVRNKVEGTTERPRLAVFRSNSHIYAQVIDDSCGNTLVAASSLTPAIREQLTEGSGSNVDAARMVGSKIAEMCKEKNIEQVCFDRGGFQYHGRVEALADAAREGGLAF